MNSFCDGPMFEDMQVIMKKWQERLKLTDWDIRLIENCAPDEMCDNVGTVNYNIIKKQAIIKLLDPRLYRNELFEYNVRKTIIHELMHLKFALLDDTGDELHDKVIHIMVDELAGLLYALRYDNFEKER